MPDAGSYQTDDRKQAGTLQHYGAPGAGTEELVLETPNGKGPIDWSRDGRFLLYQETDPKTGSDLKALGEMTGNDRKSVTVVNTPFDERQGQFSPDGRWVAYATNESGQFEIVVQPFPEPTGKWHLRRASRVALRRTSGPNTRSRLTAGS
jgi:Tol biopolymer transport system component